jgi:hypothetical protein
MATKRRSGAKAADPNRQRPLHDVRYFEGDDPSTALPPYAGKSVKLPKSMIAFGQRLGRLAEQRGVSIGRASHLYLCFNTSLAARSVARVRPPLPMWPWFDVVDYGLRKGFNSLKEQSRIKLAQDATFAVLEAVTVSGKEALPGLKRDLVGGGEALRVAVREKVTKQYRVRIEQTVPVHPRRAEVFARIVACASGVEVVVKLGESLFYDEVPTLVGAITTSGDVLRVRPRQSFRASVVSAVVGALREVDLGALFSERPTS